MTHSCIRIDCKCNSFIQLPTKNAHKGTLLNFNTSCQQCHHSRDEHRKLTESDHFIRAEFEDGARNPCQERIPVHQLSRTSLFGTYDPILIHNDDAPDEIEEEALVPCPCRGFHHNAMVTVMQKHQSMPRSKLNQLLPHISCSQCSHTLMKHQRSADTSSTSLRIHLHSTCSTNRHICISDYGPLVCTFMENSVFSIVAVVETQDGGLGLVHHWCSTAGDIEEDTCEDEAMEVSIQLDKVSIKSKDTPSGQNKRGRRLLSGCTPTRRSARLAGKSAGGAGVSERERAAAVEQRRAEEEKKMKVITCSMVSLMECMKTVPVQQLPLELQDATIQCITACWVKSSSSSSPILLVAIGLHNGSVGAFLTTSTPRFSWLLTAVDSSSVSSMSFNEDQNGAVSRLLSVGYASGRVVIVSVASEVSHWEELSEREPWQQLFSSIDYCHPITFSSWSTSDNGLLAVGNDIGEVVIYKIMTAETSFAQSFLSKTPMVSCLGKLHCSAAKISCVKWIQDRVFAVGSHDNLIQVIEVSPSSPPPLTVTGHYQQSLITSYFQSSSDPTIAHICTLKGHESFVSSMSVMNKHLLSVGWDSQLLVWPSSEISAAVSSCTQAIVKERREVVTGARGRRGHFVRVPRHRQLVEKLDLEPKQVFRIGPQRHVRFLPLGVQGIGDRDGERGLIMMLTLDGQRANSTQLTAALYSGSRQVYTTLP